jgi:plasmid stabilization system protein ParE
MKKSISIHEVAEIEINDAADFYDLESPGLGNAFLDEIQKTLERISLLPEAAVKRNKFRIFTLSRFPYYLIYLNKADEIRVLAVAHQKRRPFYWRSRK